MPTLSKPIADSVPAPAPDETEGALEALTFLADGNRLRILRVLSQRESCVCELIEHLGLPQPLMSYHLRRLREAGLVRSRRKAQWVYYSLEPQAWERFTRPIRLVCQSAGLPPEAAFGASECCDGKPAMPALGASEAAISPWPED